jgi:hypothetical protein
VKAAVLISINAVSTKFQTIAIVLKEEDHLLICFQALLVISPFIEQLAVALL